MAADSLRLDKYLWFARLVRQRSSAAAIAEGGHLRIDGRVVERAHAAVRVGNVLSVAHAGRVRVVRVEALPDRRGGAAVAMLCYADLSPARHVPPRVDLPAPAPVAGAAKGAALP